MPPTSPRVAAPAPFASTAKVRAVRGARVLVATLASTLGCNQAFPEIEPEPPPDPGPATDAEGLLSLERLPRLDLTLDAAAWAALEAAPKEWVHGDFAYEGIVLQDVGIRLKGNHSFRPLDEKASFKIKFNAFTPGRRFLGLEGLTLNSMVVDSSMLREWVGYRIFRALDVPAPRAGFAEVWLNDEPYGLYVNLEPYDDEFLARVYDDPSGNLYESDVAADLDRDPSQWDQDEGEDLTRTDLIAFSALAQREGNEVFYGDEAAVHMPRFLAFMAGEVLVGHFDGHMGGHNFFIYHEPAPDQWSYQPWSLDQALVVRVGAYDHEGFLGAKCMHDERCLVDYVQAFDQALDRYAALDLDAEIDQAIALTHEAMLDDPRRPYDEDAVEAGRQRVRGFVGLRRQDLEPQIDCLVDGVQPDADDDGFGPCFQDCDESNPAIHPDAPELCDGIDNDCTGFADDVPTCDCPSVTSEGRTFYLCHNKITWLDARAYCEAQGRTLAKFDSASQTAEVWAAAEAIAGGRWAIGLNDRGEEESYRWLDDTAPSFDNWASGEPSHQLEWFDCVMLRGGKWSECNCIEKGSFICSDEPSG